MSCDLHPFNPAIGVCATCLHDRLVVLAATTTPSSSPPSSPNSISAIPSPTHNPPLSRPISPYLPFSGPLDPVTPFHSQPLFFSTPHLAPIRPEPSRTFSRFRSFSFLSSLLRSRSPRTAETARRPARRPNRGLSPESTPDEDPPPPSRVPAPSPMRKGRPGSASGGFAVCFGPLVRVAPQRRACYDLGGELGFSGELRKTGASAAVAAWHDRSRRFVAHGRSH